MTTIDDMKQRLAEKDAVFYEWDKSLPYGENVENMSCLSCIEHKAVKTNFQRGYTIPANSNIVDTNLYLAKKSLRLEGKDSFDDLSIFWQSLCDNQRKNIIGHELEFNDVVVAKEIFTRFPEERDQIDLPQTLRLFNILKQSRDPENQALLPEIEKDLQSKAWHYFCSDRLEDDKKLRPTLYSVSCMDELKDYMTRKMHAPIEVITPKLEHVKETVKEKIYTSQLILSPEAEEFIYTLDKKQEKSNFNAGILKSIGRNGGNE